MYKLQKYECQMCMLFKEISEKIDISSEIYNYYEKIKPADLTKSFLYSLYLEIMRRTDYKLYDKMRLEEPDFNDSDLHTLLRSSFYATFHRTVCEYYDAEKIAHSYNLRDF